MTLQSAHIFSRSSAPGSANIECPARRDSMLPIIFSVPSGLPQRVQLKITASLTTCGCFASGASDSRGTSVIASSGTGHRAEPALHALGLDEAQLRNFGLRMVEDRAFRAGTDARQAKRAGVAVDVDPAKRRAGGQRDLG